MGEKEPAGGEDEKRALGTNTDAPQCPLHFTMQQLAHAAVSQLVQYAHGEYVPRPELVRDLDRWQRLHALIARGICPAARAGSTGSADLEAALALVPEGQYTGLREMLMRCAACEHGNACPLEQESTVNLFGEE